MNQKKLNTMDGFISRPFHCLNHEKHEKATHYVVWGGTRQTLLLYTIKYRIFKDITPHLVSYKGISHDKKVMPVAISCGVIGCGIDLKDPDDLSKGIIFNTIKPLVIPITDWNALVLFRDTGYEI